MTERKAHDINDKERTEDIRIHENVDFESMYLSDHVLSGLKASGFEKPSPIQLAAIPIGRCGLDMVVQAKSGTGKTCVFTVVALEMVSVSAVTTQVLILTPTREIAVQVTQVINAIGSKMQGLRASTFIGGMNLTLDKVKLQCCHIAVGTPGRITQLIEMGDLRLDNIRLLVLDEADQLLAGQFADGIAHIASGLPLNKQVVATSATYAEDIAKVAEGLMRSPNHVRLGKESPALIGVDQHIKSLPYHTQLHRRQQAKFLILMNILCKVTFNQCLIFSNSQLRAESVCNKLRVSGWPVSFLTGGQAQQDRLKALDALCSYKCRILVSTDLSARGLDSEHVNLVINLDIPRDHATYLHRVGRAGRFGSRGCAITLACEGDEWCAMRAIATMANVHIYVLKDDLNLDIAKGNNEDREYLKLMTEEEFAQVNISEPYENDTRKKDRSKRPIENLRNVPLSEHQSRKRNDCDRMDNTTTMSGKGNGHLSHSCTNEDCRKDKVVSKSKQVLNGNDRKCEMYLTKKSKQRRKEMEKKVQEENEKEKARNSSKVLGMLKRVNIDQSSSFVSFENIMTQVSEKYDSISPDHDPSVYLPPLSDTFSISKSDEQALTAYWKTVEEDLQEVILRTDESWKDFIFNFENDLQEKIEGKEKALFFETTDKREDRDEHISTKYCNGDRRESSGEVESSSSNSLELKFKVKGKQTASVTPKRDDSYERSSRHERTTSTKITAKLMKGTNRKEGLCKRNKKVTRLDSDDVSYQRYFNKTDVQADYPEYNHEDLINYNYYGNGTDKQMNDCYRSDVNYDSFIRSSQGKYQKYLDGAEKFAAIMEYVQTMGKISCWIARDYLSDL